MKKKLSFIKKKDQAMKPVSIKSTTKSIKILRIAAWVLAGISTISLIALLISVLKLNILPAKYLAIVISVIAVIAAINLFLAIFPKKEKILKIISIVLSVILSGIAIFGFIKVMDTINFFSNFGATTTTSTYDVLVAKGSYLDENSDLKEHEIQVYEDLTIDSNVVVETISKELGASTVFSSDLLNLINYALDDNSHIIALNAGTYEALLEDNDSYKDKLKIIKTFDIVTEAEETKELDVTNTPFTIYLSGIDTRTGTLPARSLSDVNIVMVVNPQEHKLLMVSTPRDFYVHLAGTDPGALPDKLTHAGSRGGVLLSKATMEELLGIEINYYARVNFNFVKNLVDAIGGITVNSDVNYSFTCKANKNCTIHPGANAVGGDCALAFSRERKAYSNGDRHRGENQEQVISLIFDKLTKSSTLLSSYSSILAALEGTFETSFTMDDISKFIKYQLEDMHGWTVESQNLNGTGGMAFTYSYPSQALSIMRPDQATIDAAKAKINEYLGIEPEVVEEPEAPAETPAE